MKSIRRLIGSRLRRRPVVAVVRLSGTIGERGLARSGLSLASLASSSSLSLASSLSTASSALHIALGVSKVLLGHVSVVLLGLLVQDISNFR